MALSSLIPQPVTSIGHEALSADGVIARVAQYAWLDESCETIERIGQSAETDAQRIARDLGWPDYSEEMSRLVSLPSGGQPGDPVTVDERGEATVGEEAC